MIRAGRIRAALIGAAGGWFCIMILPTLMARLISM